MINIQIALDGPSGSGKSTMAKRISHELGFCYIDTGALYRAVGLYMLSSGIDIGSREKIAAALPDAKVNIDFSGDQQLTYLCGNDVSEKIRTPEVARAASYVSAVPEVRRMLLKVQRTFAAGHNILMDGRDIGTTVLPEAQIKVFLTATAEDRAQRRYSELSAKGEKTSYEDVLSQIKERDYRDEHRDISPLRSADDAIIVDTTGLTLEEGFEKVKKTIFSRLEEL